MYKHSCYIVIKRGSGAVGKFPAPFIVSLFMGIGRDTKPFSRRLGRVAPPEMGNSADVKLSVGIQPQCPGCQKNVEWLSNV